MFSGWTKRCLLLLVLFPTLSRAEQPKPLLEIFRDVPGIQDGYEIRVFPDHEELSASSNLFFLPRQEFGHYVRAPTDLVERVEQLVASGAGFTKPASRTWDLAGWHALIRNEEIDASDPRYSKLFALMRREIKHGGWRREDVTIARLKRGIFIHVARLQYRRKPSHLMRPRITRTPVRDGLETCPNVIDDHLVCRIDPGFILLAKPGGRYD